jgi:methyltransferase (TIGR00027 family)
MAIFRAIEQSGQSPGDRLLNDPWAVHLIPSRWWRVLLQMPRSGWLLQRIAGRLFPGAQEYAVLRARVVDDLTRALAGSWLKQVVLLGAGFDTMSFRLRDSLTRIPVFEVDHPATQAAKRTGRARLAASEPPRFVPVDFEKDDLVQRLTASGFNTKRRSLLTWLGVSSYLTTAAVRRTFEQMARLCAPGSQLVFDYIPQDVIAGKSRSQVASATIKHFSKLGEPVIFGLDPARVDLFLRQFGFRVISELGPETLRRRYCRGNRAPVDFMNIVICERT